ncbi:MAG TPA: S-adenosylmethionine:tRNA ribosyltransferase-isomerase [Candidatus Baltobacteraceae bacterium]|jgi:S-adenosylmethionine:tRNA ribosyltransferase-isomerase|nr:S-adenosylmethionine:tRNA ribosyltransferase-isomerase [Candidatus Baltobacteraceae bacterium]
MNEVATIVPRLREANVPPERRGIARDAVRMLVTDRAKMSGGNEHVRFSDLPRFVNAGDVLVVNDSATMPAALHARREEGESLEIHISTMLDPQLWIVEPRGSVFIGEELFLEDGARATLLAAVNPDLPRLWYARFVLPIPMQAFLAKFGEPIHYRHMTKRFPLSYFQTIFARVPGSAEMPSAARPFTERTIRDLQRAGATIASITLHCGVSSFETPERPGIERFTVSPEAVRTIASARANGGRIIAVGTSVVRALESAVDGGKLIAASGWTDLVIEPESHLQVADALLTGFHEPTATHIGLVGAFVSKDCVKRVYEEAAEAGYEGHEFGDIHAIF